MPGVVSCTNCRRLDIDTTEIEKKLYTMDAKKKVESPQVVVSKVNNIPVVLARLRLGAQLAQKKLGRLVGLQQKAISRLEIGRIKEIDIHRVEQIANVCGYDMEIVFRKR